MADQNQDQLSNEDMAALHEAWGQLQAAGDPRAEKVRQYIVAQGNSILHPTDNEGALGRAWNWANQGLISKDTVVRALSGRTPDQLKQDTEPSQWDTPSQAAGKAWLRGATLDTGDIGSSLTSPVSVATMAAGGAGAIPKAAEALGASGKALTAAKALGTAGKVASTAAAAGFGVQGAAQAAQAAPGAANLEPNEVQKFLTGSAMAAGGAAGVTEGVAPKLGGGPIAEIPGELTAKASSGLRTVGQAVLPSLVDGPAEQMVTRAIKPGKNNIGWDDDVKMALPQMKAAETSLGKPIANVDDAIQAASIAKKQVWGQYQDLVGDYGKAASIDGNAIADAMLQSVDKRTALQNPNLAKRVEATADTYRRPLTLAEAEDFLQSANQDLTTYYQKNKVGRSVAESDPETAATVAEAGALRKQLYDRIDALSGPGAADIKRQYGALSNVESELIGRRNVSARQQPMSLNEQISTARGYGKMAKGVLTLSPGDLVEGAETLGTAKYLKERQSTDSMIERAFKKVSPAPPATGPVRPPVAGLLKSAPYITPGPADTSGPIPYQAPAYANDTRAQRLGLLLPERAGGPQVTPYPGVTPYFVKQLSEPPSRILKSAPPRRK